MVERCSNFRLIELVSRIQELIQLKLNFCRWDVGCDDSEEPARRLSDTRNFSLFSRSVIVNIVDIFDISDSSATLAKGRAPQSQKGLAGSIFPLRLPFTIRVTWKSLRHGAARNKEAMFS